MIGANGTDAPPKCTHDPQSTFSSEDLTDLAGQAGLADAGFAVDDDRLGDAGDGVSQRVAEELLFGSASGEAMIGLQTPHVYSVNTLRRLGGSPWSTGRDQAFDP